ncbi:amidohydrolase family protein [Streptomyces boninensis]|uniref:amidohydrolase family protein n=1 Tax=Streptomyces boninensis TaxID=2039455 RepID=UPI003B21F332
MDLQLPPLVDHHCHGVLRTGPEPPAFERYLTESAAPAAPGTSYFDSQLGFAVRRWCPPLLDLEPHCPPEVYLARRSELGSEEATRRLLQGAGIGAYAVDTGLPGDLTDPGELVELAGGTATAHEIVRLETLAESLASKADSPADLLDAIDAAVADATRTATGFKSIAAYRHGLDFDPAPPAREEAERAATRWLAAGAGRLDDPVLIRHLLWSAIRTGRPLQLHTGFGDTDLKLHRADPLLLTDFLHATAPLGTPVVLLHGYPYHRHAAYLSAVFPHAHADVGLALSHTGTRAEAVLAETLELAPFGKLLFSTDAYALPELYVTGAQLFREALTRLLTRWTADGSWSEPDAHRVATLLAADNARRVYGLA